MRIRRAFASVLCIVIVALASAHAESVQVLVQSSPLAGYQYGAGKEVWSELKVGDRLTLVREADNPYDANAVRIEWQGNKLGYLPRRENRSVAAEMDRGTTVEARIERLVAHRNPWRRIRVEVWVRL